MVSKSRLIVGIVFILAGLSFVFLSFFAPWWMVLYSIPLFIIGIFVLMNESEDKIEKRKDIKEKEYKK